MQNLEEFKDLLASPKKIVITTHYKPDADALGSSLGLMDYLKKKDHNVTVITPTDYPDFLAWMHGNDEVVVDMPRNRSRVVQLIQDAELIFCLDFSGLHRIGDLGEMVRAAKGKKVLIDHHLDPEDFADFVKWSTGAAATAELIYELIEEMGDQDLIDQNIAESLYAGIMTDTGQFKHSNTTVNVHHITAKLIDKGADVTKVGRLIYDTNSVDRLRFVGYALSQKLKVLPEYNTAYISITDSELTRFNSKTGDTEGLVNFALSIEGVIFAAVIIEKNDIVKMSFRSLGDFSVNTFAKDYFNGGGHKNAAGGRSTENLENTVEYFESLLPKFKEELNDYAKPFTANVES